MIVGPGWGFLGLLAVGLAAFALVPGCGLVVVDRAPTGDARLAAPGLVDAVPAVEVLPAGVWTLSRARARSQVRRAVLRVKTPGCDGSPTGSGFALDTKLLLAQREVVPGASPLRVAGRKGGARSVRAVGVFRLGELGIAVVDRRLPRTPTAAGDVLGASVAIVAYPLSAKPRLLRGVVVDRVAGGRYGVRGDVVRLTSVLGADDPGGPVLDAKGRLVAVAFTTDPRTGLAVAVPIRSLRSLVARRALETLEPCRGA